MNTDTTPAVAPETSRVIARLIDAAVAVIRANAEMLGDLDRAVGDGDHGVNMLRGFNAIAEARASISALPLTSALDAMGRLLVMSVGGASGPLYGSLLMAMGGAGARDLAPPSLREMLAAGVAAVKKRGRSDRGEKTMLDVLVPVQLAWERACAEGGLGTDVGAIKRCIEQVYGPKGVAVLVDLGGAETNSEMAIEMLPKDWQANIVICSAPVVEGAVMAATEAAGGSSLAKVRATAGEMYR